jgi:ABC-type transport system substrate-binding protein
VWIWSLSCVRWTRCAWPKSLRHSGQNRAALVTVFGLFNMRAGSPWQDVRLRQAANVAINREDLIRYATKGNGVVVPALVAAGVRV